MKSKRMNIRNKGKALFTAANIFLAVVLFQNCGESFQPRLSNKGNGGLDLPSNENENEIDNSGETPTTTGKIYYVSTTGSNSNLGTSIDKPLRTVSHAVDKMVAGDTTYVKSGVYNETLISFGRSGTERAPIRLLNSPGELPVINCMPSTSEDRNMILIQNGTGYKNKIGWIAIEGFEIRNCWHGINMYNAHDTVIRRNWIHSNRFQGILGNGKNILIDRNRISKNGDFIACDRGGKNQYGTDSCILDHGIYAAGTGHRITNNIIDNNLSSGIQVNGSSSSKYDPDKHAGPDFAGAQNWLIANNTFARQNNCDAVFLWGSGVSDIKIINNIFYENAYKGASYRGNGITLSSPSRSTTGIEINNNLSYSSQRRTFLDVDFNTIYTEGINYTQSGNTVNTVDPSFEDEQEQNFRLKPGSPAINAGMTLLNVKTDFRGLPRPQRGAFDIGAYEF